MYFQSIFFLALKGLATANCIPNKYEPVSISFKRPYSSGPAERKQHSLCCGGQLPDHFMGSEYFPNPLLLLSPSEVPGPFDNQLNRGPAHSSSIALINIRAEMATVDRHN